MSSVESKFVQCPICSKSFSQQAINRHVDKCLGDEDSSNSNGSPETAAFSCTKRNISKSPLSMGIKRTSPSSPTTNILTLAGNLKTSPPLKKLKTQTMNSETSRREAPKEKRNCDKPFSERSLANEVSSTIGAKPNVQSKPKTDDVLTKKPEVKKEGDRIPLAEKMRPRIMNDFVGQNQVLGANTLLKNLLEAEKIPSMIFWGPPGCGKTSLAHVIASKVRKGNKTRFVKLSAVTSGVNDVKEVIKVAKNEQKMFKRKTILFVDEIHRFNKLQQDAFLPHIEDGTIVLIGATTENPSFQVNAALLSRCRVLVLEKLSCPDVERILLRALESLDATVIKDDPTPEQRLAPGTLVQEKAIKLLAGLCDGDARIALNALQVAVESVDSNQTSEPSVVTSELIMESLQKNHLLYDRNGEEHYNMASALQKSIRGSDDNAAIYWTARMLEGGEDPLFIARRLVVTASEDIGLADPLALPLAVSTFQACQFIGMPECRINLAQAVVYLARAPKSTESYKALGNAIQSIKEHKGPLPGVPLHLRNAPTTLMKNLGYGKGYEYTHKPRTQEFLPQEMAGTSFF